jgi:hypothetical protein
MGFLKTGKSVAFTPRKFSFSWFVRTKSVPHFAKIFIAKERMGVHVRGIFCYTRKNMDDVLQKNVRKT